MILDFDKAIREYRRLQREKPELLRFKVNPREWDKFANVSDINAKHADKCPTCGFLPGERGFVRLNWPIRHEFFGAAIKCPRCWGGRG